MGENIFGMVPAIEGSPVVASHKEREAMGREVAAEMPEGVPCVGRLR